MESYVYWYRVSVWDDEKVLEIVSGNGVLLANILNATELYTETQLKWQLLCCVYFTTLKNTIQKKSRGNNVKFSVTQLAWIKMSMIWKKIQKCRGIALN